MNDEAKAVAERYARRAEHGRYSALQPDVWQTMHERQRLLLRALARRGLDPAALRALEVGCGSGGNLLELLRIGFAPRHLTGIELLAERYDEARARLPSSTVLWLGDAMKAPVARESQDLVLQATVFSSLLDEDFRRRLAERMWSWLKPGGAVLWYDLAVDNPRNADVRGLPRAAVEALFPEGRIEARRVTLAPPLARRVCGWHPSFYGLFNALPALRTHLMAWIAKPA